MIACSFKLFSIPRISHSFLNPTFPGSYNGQVKNNFVSDAGPNPLLQILSKVKGAYTSELLMIANI